MRSHRPTSNRSPAQETVLRRRRAMSHPIVACHTRFPVTLTDVWSTRWQVASFARSWSSRPRPHAELTHLGPRTYLPRYRHTTPCNVNGSLYCHPPPTVLRSQRLTPCHCVLLVPILSASPQQVLTIFSTIHDPVHAL